VIGLPNENPQIYLNMSCFLHFYLYIGVLTLTTDLTITAPPPHHPLEFLTTFDPGGEVLVHQNDP